MSFLSNIFSNINLYYIPAALLAITVHESAHGYMAMRLGDPTARRSGRISLNPLHHVDIMGLLMLMLLGFGWAKPVPVDPRYFRDPKKGMALTSLAGPVSNLLLALVALFFCELIAAVFTGGGSAAVIFYKIFLYTAVVSVGLGIFNLIPIPPLDGSKLLYAFLPDRAWFTVLRYERYGMLLLVLIMFSGFLDGPLSAARSAVVQMLWSVAAFPVEQIQRLF